MQQPWANDQPAHVEKQAQLFVLPGDLGVLLYDGQPDEGRHVQNDPFHNFNNYKVSLSRLGNQIGAATDYLDWYSVGLLHAPGSPVAQDRDQWQP